MIESLLLVLDEEDREAEKLLIHKKLSGSCVKIFQLNSNRSESSLSLLSLCEGSFGNIPVKGELQFGFIYNTSRWESCPSI